MTGNLSGIHVLYIVDTSNGGANEQYPEALMKLQDRQQYCLLLSIKEAKYDKASMKVVFYDKDLDGLWREVAFAEGALKDFSIDDNYAIVFSGITLEQLLGEAKSNFTKKQEEEKERRIEAEKLRGENLRRKQAEEKRRKEHEEKRRLEAEKQQEEKRQREEDFKHNMESNFSQQETQVRDANGNRWIKCEYCGKIAMDNEFNYYGGFGHINLGTCKECSANNPVVKGKSVEQAEEVGKKYDPTICPECGGKLRERSGPFGRFFGCSNYPRCRYTKPIRN